MPALPSTKLRYLRHTVDVTKHERMMLYVDSDSSVEDNPNPRVRRRPLELVMPRVATHAFEELDYFLCAQRIMEKIDSMEAIVLQ